MTLKLKFRLDNGKPFDDPAERDRILRGIAHGNQAGAIRDANGNRIGQYAMTEDEGT